MAVLQVLGGDLDGLPLHYLAGGRGPAVVLLHGLGGFAASWRTTMGALDRQVTAYALDLPGFGASGKPRLRYDLDLFARAVQGFLDGLGLASASLVGHSLGAAVAIHYALRYPARVERLALLSPVVPGVYRLSRTWRLGRWPVVADLAALVRCRPLYRAAVRRCFHVPCPQDVRFLVEHAWAERSGRAARTAFLATLRHVGAELVERAGDYRRAIATFDRPVLIVHGNQDPVIPAAGCRAAAAAFPRAVLRSVEGCGHFPQFEHPATVNGWLAEFLAGRPVPH